MSKNLRYKGGFYSKANVLYDVELWQEGYEGDVQTVAFCSQPLEIEWPETDKLEPVQGSRATLQLYSDTDRQFVDLYTIRAGSIRLDVYRAKELYWSGTLDPELYEEPFAFNEGYGVTLTFADMAVLERQKWNRGGFMTIRELLEYLLHEAGIRYTAVEESVSTKLGEFHTDRLLDAVSVQTENFYDEDGEPMTNREVLDETLRPFALRLIQKEGKVVVYDLNSLHTTLDAETVHWEADDAVLGVDKVYNNVRVAFSPYERTNLLNGEVESKKVGSGRTVTVWLNTSAAADEKGFTIHLSDTGKGLEINPKARFYTVEPIYSGSEEMGVAWTVQSCRPGGDYTSHLNMPSEVTGEMLFKVPRLAYVANTGYTDRQNHLLKLTMQMLFDPRYNPFEQASGDNEERHWDDQANWANYAYVPFLLTLKDADGNALYHWENKSVVDKKTFVRQGNCAWVAGAGAWGDAWMCWYKGNRQNESGLGGWEGNKQVIGYYRKGLPASFDKMDKGEYVDMPPVSGWLELQVGTGVPAYDYKSKSDWQIKPELYRQCRWLLYKNPALDLTDRYGKKVASEDVVHSAWLNPDAKEGLEIDTVLGTLRQSSPTALGQFFRSSDKSVLGQFFRGGSSDLLERLLIGTVYSNYADRHSVLSGTVRLLPSFGIYTDTHEPGKYLLLAETQRLRDDESEIKMVQFNNDNYQGVNFNETV